VAEDERVAEFLRRVQDLRLELAEQRAVAEELERRLLLVAETLERLSAT
jgi:hypothetical protein